MRRIDRNQTRRLLDDLLDTDSGLSDVPELPGYVIEGLIGEGASSVVFLATHEASHRKVAIKFFKRHVVDRAALLRFRREVSSLSRIDHPGCARLLDCGEAHGGMYIVQAYVDGVDIRTFARTHGLEVTERVRLVAHIARSLQAVHNVGIVHRDIKPDNILVNGDGQPIIIDFGIASGEGRGFTRGITNADGGIGTPRYMSPEQRAGDADVSPASDVYALARVLIELIHPGDELDVELGPVSVPQKARLVQILREATHESAAQRTARADAFAEQLEGWCRSSAGHRPTRIARFRPSARTTIAAVCLLLLLLSFGFSSAVRDTVLSLVSRSSGTSTGTYEENLMNNKLITIATAAAASLGPGLLASAQECWDHDTTFLDPANDPDAIFGRRILLDGELIAIGAPFDDLYAENAGAVHLYRKVAGQWVFDESIINDDVASEQWFGSAIAIDGRTLLVGASHDDTLGDNAGAVYVFEEFDGVGWIQTQKILPDQVSEGAWFGHSIACEDGVAVVGAHQDDTFEVKTGSVFVFRDMGAGWVQEASFQAPDAHSWQQFGQEVDISGETIVAGANYDDGLGGFSGAAYVYGFDGTDWSFQQKLTSMNGGSSDYFGEHVAISGDTIVATSWHRNTERGVAVVFERDGGVWTEVGEITASDAQPNDVFGYSVDLRDDLLLVGAISRERADAPGGGAYLFRRTGSTWNEVRVFTADVVANSHFGKDVSISPDGAIAIGADAFHVSDSGRVVTFDNPCQQLFTVSPTPLVARETGLFIAEGLQPDSPSYLVYSLAGLGQTPVPHLNIILDLASPALASGPRWTNDAGEVTWSGIMPGVSGSTPIWFQVAQPNLVTNHVATSIEP